jgi:small subunit ribosomal protein S9
LTEAEHPHDEQRSDEQQDAVTESGPVTPEPVGEPAAAQEAPAPAPEELIPIPVAERPADERPVDEQPAAEVPAPAPAPAAEQPPAAAPAPEAPVPVAQERADEVLEDEPDEVEVAPRQRPEIPGADLIPDIVSETDEFLDAEARAAAEAEAEAAAARDEEESVVEAQPIADAAIDLAAGARYTATGKRKTAVARVIIKPGSGTYSINGKPLDQFFPRETLQRVIRQPLEAVGYESRMDVVARMHGGGVSAQAGALRHGISRALIVADPNLRGELKRRGFLTRDPRVKERKKAGLKKARKRPQFSKR